jgi:hypothetical protein
VRVRDLPGAVQVHQPGREHLAVDPVVAAFAFGEQRDDRRRDRADARLQRAAVVDERRGVPRDRAVDVGRRRVLQRERRPVTDHEHVDRVDVDPVRVLLVDAERAG